MTKEPTHSERSPLRLIQSAPQPYLVPETPARISDALRPRKRMECHPVGRLALSFALAKQDPAGTAKLLEIVGDRTAPTQVGLYDPISHQIRFNPNATVGDMCKFLYLSYCTTLINQNKLGLTSVGNKLRDHLIDCGGSIWCEMGNINAIPLSEHTLDQWAQGGHRPGKLTTDPQQGQKAGWRYFPAHAKEVFLHYINYSLDPDSLDGIQKHFYNTGLQTSYSREEQVRDLDILTHKVLPVLGAIPRLQVNALEGCETPALIHEKLMTLQQLFEASARDDQMPFTLDERALSQCSSRAFDRSEPSQHPAKTKKPHLTLVHQAQGTPRAPQN